MNLEVLLMYSAVSFLYIISPGPAIVLAISNGLKTNMRIVVISSLGNIVGILLLSVVSISGLGALLVTSSLLFIVVKIIGVFYLIYFGFRQFTNGKSLLSGDIYRHDKLRYIFFSFFYEAFFLAVTNPKPVLFFTALFPQFLNLDTALMPQFFIMTAIFMLFSFLSLCSYGFISKSAKSYFTNQDRMTWFHRITGGIFISMGIGLSQLKNAQS